MERHIYECCPRATIEIKNGLTAKVLTRDHPHYDESIEPLDENNNNRINLYSGLLELDASLDVESPQSEEAQPQTEEDNNNIPAVANRNNSRERAPIEAQGPTSPDHNHHIPAVATQTQHRKSRKRAPIWQYFENDGDHVTFRLKRRCRCCFCHEVMQSQPKRMERHLLRTCTRVPSDVLQDYRQTIHEEEMKKTLACVPVVPSLVSHPPSSCDDVVTTPELIQYYPFHLYTIWIDPNESNLRYIQILVLLPTGLTSEDCFVHVHADLLILGMTNSGTLALQEEEEENDHVEQQQQVQPTDWTSTYVSSSSSSNNQHDPQSYFSESVPTSAHSALEELHDQLLHARNHSSPHPPPTDEPFFSPSSMGASDATTVHIPLPLFGSEEIVTISSKVVTASDEQNELVDTTSNILTIQLRGPVRT